MSGYQPNNMNPNQMGMSQGQQVQMQQMYQQQQQAGMNMNRMGGSMVNMQQQAPQHQQQHGGMNQGQQMQMHQQMYQQQQQPVGLSVRMGDSSQSQHLQQTSGLLGQPPPQSNPAVSAMSGFAANQISTQMNPGSAGSMHHQMPSGNGAPSTPQQQQLSAPSVSASGDTPSPIPPITNPSSQQPPLSNAPASISSDIPTANSVLASTPGPSTAFAGDGLQNSGESASQTSDVAPMLIRSDLIGRARDMMNNQLRFDLQQMMGDISGYTTSCFGESSGCVSGADARLTTGPPSVTAPLSVNDLQSLGVGDPSSVKSSEGPHSVGGGSVKPEECKNFYESMVQSSYNTIGTIDQILMLMETAKQSMSHVHRMEKMVQAVPLGAGQQHTGQSNNETTTVLLTQQAGQQLDNQEQIDSTCSNAIRDVLSMINAVNAAEGRGTTAPFNNFQQNHSLFNETTEENGGLNHDSLNFGDMEPEADDDELNF